MLHVSTTSVALANSYAGAIQIRHHGISLTLVDCRVLPVKSGEPFSTTARREMFPFLYKMYLGMPSLSGSVPSSVAGMILAMVERRRRLNGAGQRREERSELRKHTSLCCLEPGTRVAHAISLLDQPPSVPPIVEEWPGNPENECAYTPGFQATGNTDHLIKAKCQPITPEAGRKSTKEQRCPRESNICDLVQSVRMLEHDLCCHVIDLVMVVRSTTIGLHSPSAA